MTGDSCNRLVVAVYTFGRTYLVKSATIPSDQQTLAGMRAAELFKATGRPDLADTVTKLASEVQDDFDLLDDGPAQYGVPSVRYEIRGNVLQGHPGDFLRLGCPHHGTQWLPRAELRQRVKAAKKDQTRRKAMLDMQTRHWRGTLG